jgi:hypothetical protein
MPLVLKVKDLGKEKDQIQEQDQEQVQELALELDQLPEIIQVLDLVQGPEKYMIVESFNQIRIELISNSLLKEKHSVPKNNYREDLTNQILNLSLSKKILIHPKTLHIWEQEKLTSKIHHHFKIKAQPESRSQFTIQDQKSSHKL